MGSTSIRTPPSPTTAPSLAKPRCRRRSSPGPIACGINAAPIHDYLTGIATGPGGIDHVISVVGWGTDAKEVLYWVVRNSWGEYWGEEGYVRVKSGQLSVEDQCAWAVPKDFTAPEWNNEVHCFEDGSNCKAKEAVETLVI